MSYQIKYSVVSRSSPRTEGYLVQDETLNFNSKDRIKEWLIDQFGKVPKVHNRNKIYIDDKDGNAQEVGFTYSQWVKEYTRKGEMSFFCTYWIELRQLEIEPLLLNRVIV